MRASTEHTVTPEVSSQSWTSTVPAHPEGTPSVICFHTHSAQTCQLRWLLLWY